MPGHFIYDTLDPNQLHQGDVLKRTDELVDLLKRIHRHYAEHDSYRYFLVLTQSCDLVRRDNTAYITIAAVRPVEDVLSREARQYQEWWEEPKRIIDADAYNKLRLFGESLLNNNVSNYFYLHQVPEKDGIVTEPACAFLALSITLRIEHYDLCLAAKVAQIKEGFRAKLGWLVGDIYSRIGTTEWDEIYGQNSAGKNASGLLKTHFLKPIDKRRIEQATDRLKQSAPLESYSPDEILEAISNTRIVKRRERFKNQLQEILSQSQFLERLCGYIFQSVHSNSDLDTQLRSLFDITDDVKLDKITRKIRDLFNSVIRKTLCDEKFTGKDKTVSFLVSEIMKDTVVKDIIR